LSQLARYLKPIVEARLKKEVQDSAILMNLSRLQQTFDKKHSFKEEFVIQKLSLQSNLFTMTFSRTARVQQQIHRFQKLVLASHGFISVTESNREITILTDLRFLERLSDFLTENPIYSKTQITGIGIQFDPSYSAIPGFISLILQKIALQGVNLVELFSTHTEIMIFFDPNDAKIAFDTLYNCFQVEEF
jgi:hypothetical protein